MSARTCRTPAGTAPPAIEISNPAGTVSVEAVEGAEDLDVSVEALDPVAEELLDRVDITADGDAADRDGAPVRLRITVPKLRLFRTPAFAVRVTTPPDAATRVAVASADVELRGRLGRVVLTAASGDLAVDHCTELQLRAASGDARIGTVAGRATVGTASGDVWVGRTLGGLEVRTASGEVVVESAQGAVSVSTASGDVSVGALGEGRLQVTTVSGNASVGVVPGLRVWLDLSSVSGRMASALDEDGADAGDGPPQLTVALRSVSGDLRIERAVAATPAG
jgi:hypothetical protein